MADPVLGKAAMELPLASRLMLEAVSQDTFQNWGQACEQELPGYFRQEAEQDFLRGKWVRLDGWWVSETEAAIHRAAFIAAQSLNESQAVVPAP